VKNSYRIIGIVLAVSGAVMAPIFYFIIGSVPLTAVGLSTLILGLTCAVLANARPYISPEASRVLLKTGMENTAALIEELGIQTRAIYLPSSLRNGQPQALIPLVDHPDSFQFKEKLPGRLIVRYGPGADDMALAVTTPGSINVAMLDNKPGNTADEIESAITYLLTGVLDIASGVKVNIADSRLVVEVFGDRMGYEDILYYQCVGSPTASIAAAVVSEALEKPVRIVTESRHKQSSRITLEVYS
jgi:hypothetical protein